MRISCCHISIKSRSGRTYRCLHGTNAKKGGVKGSHIILEEMTSIRVRLIRNTQSVERTARTLLGWQMGTIQRMQLTVPCLRSEDEASWKLSCRKRSLGVLLQAERPSLIISHSLSGLDAPPGSLQLMPTTAIGSRLPILPSAPILAVAPPSCLFEPWLTLAVSWNKVVLPLVVP